MGLYFVHCTVKRVKSTESRISETIKALDVSLYKFLCFDGKKEEGEKEKKKEEEQE